jgi:anti-sigma regulatory factor (Ser/Thr protein kinase)
MTMLSSDAPPARVADFCHQALLYSGLEGFLDGTLPFIQEGIEAGAPTLVVVHQAKIDMLRQALNGDADMVQFADMAEVGANPARIIPAWRSFVDEHASADRPVRGIGEPIYPARAAAELVECQRHEALLNVAFADAGDFKLLCPYDTDVLDPCVIDEAHRTHPHVQVDAVERASPTYLGLEAIVAPFADPLPDPPDDASQVRVDIGTLRAVRIFVGKQAGEAGIGPDRVADLVSAVSELATNSIRHGGGCGLLRMWREPASVICEVIDHGWIERPLAGREAPRVDGPDGRGLWLANQFCDLVQIRTSADGSAVRLHMRT